MINLISLTVVSVEPTLASVRLMKDKSIINKYKEVLDMSLLEQKAKPILAGKYEVTIKDFVEIENEKGGYVKVTFDVPDYGDYIYCIFPSQVNYVTSCLNQQAGLDRDTETLGDILNKIKKVNVWFSYNQDYNRMNVAFHEPVIAEEEVDI